MNPALHLLRTHFTGAVVEPGQPAYDAVSRTVLASGQPMAVLQVADVADVQVAVLFAVGAGLPLAVRGGGHSFQGFGTNDGGLVIDLSRLSAVSMLDEDRHLVRVGGGATWGQVATALAPHGLAISSGDTKSVGVGGLTLGGGIGWKVRSRGLALDNLVGAEVVTAGGVVVHASVDEHPDLFWALRGGGGNFGIVTAFDFQAHPTTDVFFGSISFPAPEAATVIHGWADYLRAAPEQLTSTVSLANPFAGGPSAPVVVQVAFDGDEVSAATRAIDPIRRLGTVLSDDVAVMPYADVLEEGAVPPPGLQFASRNALVDKESVTEALRVVADVAVAEGSPFIGLRSLGGAMSRVPDDATAYAHRQAELLVLTMSAGPPAVVAAARPRVDEMWASLAPHVIGAYANFLTRVTDEEVGAIYPAETRERLAAIKRDYDPGNLFAGNHNIRPSG